MTCWNKCSVLVRLRDTCASVAFTRVGMSARKFFPEAPLSDFVKLLVPILKDEVSYQGSQHWRDFELFVSSHLPIKKMDYQDQLIHFVLAQRAAGLKASSIATGIRKLWNFSDWGNGERRFIERLASTCERFWGSEDGVLKAPFYTLPQLQTMFEHAPQDDHPFQNCMELMTLMPLRFADVALIHGKDIGYSEDGRIVEMLVWVTKANQKATKRIKARLNISTMTERLQKYIKELGNRQRFSGEYLVVEQFNSALRKLATRIFPDLKPPTSYSFRNDFITRVIRRNTKGDKVDWESVRYSTWHDSMRALKSSYDFVLASADGKKRKTNKKKRPVKAETGVRTRGKSEKKKVGKGKPK